MKMANRSGGDPIFPVLKYILGLVCWSLFSAGCTTVPELSYDQELTGTWKFKQGDSRDFASVVLDDSSWKDIPNTLALRELHKDENGTVVWYRYKVIVPASVKETDAPRSLEFILGRIDDCDQFYLNGHLVGSNNVDGDTTFYSAGSHRDIVRCYRIAITSPLIRWGRENVLAVRVLNKGGKGGMDDLVHIRSSALSYTAANSFPARWRFRPADSAGYAAEGTVDKDWKMIHPGIDWELQGYTLFDGTAWYRTHFRIAQQAGTGPWLLRLHLGRIDDADQVYLNGALVGENNMNMSTGRGTQERFKEHPTLAGVERVYDLPLADPRIRRSSDNLLAVRVHDSGGGGGIIGTPYWEIVEQGDDVTVDLSKFYKINSYNALDTIAVIRNRNLRSPFQGTFICRIRKNSTGGAEKRVSEISIASNDSLVIPLSLPVTKEEVRLDLTLCDRSGRSVYYNAVKLPFVLVK